MKVRNPLRITLQLSALMLVIVFLPGCLLLHRHRHADLASAVNPGDQPDKILYEKAANEIEHGRYDVGRLTLQTLINTYPDSEYLAKAKLTIADSYYKEGGVSGLTQAQAEYKDFITFFPTAPEAPEAQFRVGMAHFRLMAKPDRDETEAKLAEVEFKEFLQKFPDSPLAPRVKSRLRQAQEVLAQGEYKIARFYYMKGANPAAESRFKDIVEHYPSFSQADNSLWYLGQTMERRRKAKEAMPYYARIITDYPLSPLVGDAKAKLIAMHQPVPKPTRAMLARAKADAANQPHRKDVLQQLAGLMSSSPDVSATRHGPVELSAKRTGTTETAKAQTPMPGGNTISVQPVGDSSLQSGTPVDPKSASNTAKPGPSSTSPQASNQAKTENATDSASNTSTGKKKKGKLHFLKKIVP